MKTQVIIFSSTNIATIQSSINSFYTTNPGAVIISAEMFVVRNSNTSRVYTYTITYKQ